MEHFISVSGTPRHMGFSQGKKFAANIRGSFKRLLNFEGIELIKPAFLPKFVFAGLIRMKLAKQWRTNINIIAPGLSERLKGISEGAGIPLSELYVIQALEVLSDEVNFVKTGCLSFAALPHRTAPHGAIIGKNFDFMKTFAEDNLIRKSYPKDRYSSIELTYQEVAGSHDGMNEKGLVICYNYGVTRETTQVRLPITLIIQEILENCGTTGEALGLLENFRYPNGAILLIVDAKGECVSVELTPEHIGIRKPENNLLVNTNYYHCRDTKKCDISHETHYSEKAPKSLRGIRIHESNELRYNRAMGLLRRAERIDVELAKKVLMDHDNQPEGTDNTICRHSDFFQTQVSAIFLPESRKVLIASGNPCENQYKEYQL